MSMMAGAAVREIRASYRSRTQGERLRTLLNGSQATLERAWAQALADLHRVRVVDAARRVSGMPRSIKPGPSLLPCRTA